MAAGRMTGGAMPGGADPAAALAGTGQGHEGMGQGGVGSIVGQMAGPYDGMNRAASGGMSPNPLSDLMAKIMPTLAEILGGATGGMGKPPEPAAPIDGANGPMKMPTAGGWK